MSSLSDTTPRGLVLRGHDAQRAHDATFGGSIDEALAPEHGDPSCAPRRDVLDGRAAGFERGRRDGFEAGIQAADLELQRLASEREARVSKAVAALEAATERAVLAYEEAIRRVEECVTSVAFEVTQALFDRELSVSTEPGREAITRALRIAGDAKQMTARLNPDDVATIGELGALVAGHDVIVVADPSVAAGDCVAEIGTSEIDASLSAALGRVRQVLEVPA